jgi:hypothetical protein
MMTTLFIAMMCLHPVHASLSEVQWNEEKKCIEVSLRLAPEDVDWILKSSQAASGLANHKKDASTIKNNVGVDGVSESEDPDVATAIAYLQRHYRIEPPPQASQQDPTEYRWVGRENSGGHQWWHFEMVPGEPVPPRKWSVSMLLDRGPEYQHRVVLLGQDPPKSMDFSRQQTRLSIEPWTQPTPTLKPILAGESLVPK